MKRAQWDAMSHRERDALVAEKVMGWEVTHCGRRVAPGVDRAEPWVGGAPREVRGFSGTKDARGWIALKCGHYTTTPDGMMAVVERMEGDGWSWNVGRVVNAQGKHLCVASFDKHGDATNLWDGIAQTAPEAVSLAALYALGEMEPELDPPAGEPRG